MSKLIDAARKYVGVRYRHRGRSDTALDCVGLLVRAFADCGVPTSDFIHYGREPHKNGLVLRVTEALGIDPLPGSTQLQDGDVILLRFEIEPQHMGLVAEVDYGGTPALNIIHADGYVKRVVEQRITPDVMTRITHVFRKGVL